MSRRSDDASAVPRRLTDLWKVEGDELVVLSDAHFNLWSYRLNAVGRLVWELIDGEQSAGAIAREVVARFPGQDPVAIARDVRSFLDILEQRHVIALPRDVRADVLLVVPPLGRYCAEDAAQVAENSAPPLGLLYIAAVLRNAGISVAVRDMAAEQMSVFDCARLLAEHEPTVIGLSVLTNVVAEAEEMLRQFKALRPRCLTVAGGIHPTALPGEMLQNPDLDLVLRGEGELSMPDLCRALLDRGDVGRVPGVCFKTGRDAVVCDEAPCVQDIDRLPLPARDLVDMDLYLQKGALLSSRGCPYRCYFCSAVGMNMHHYRPRRPEQVVEEMKHLESSLGVTEFEFQDDNFTAMPATCRRLCSLIEGSGYKWGCQGTLRQIAADIGLLDTMAHAGCAHIFFGLETGNDGLLQTLKGVHVEDVKRVVDRAVCLGIHVAAGFIVGHPNETQESIADSLDLALWLRERDVHTPVGVLNCFPGSPVHRDPSKYGIRLISTDYSQYVFPRVNIETRAFDAPALRRAYVDFVSKIASTYEDEG